ncbi:MAG: nucleotidyltransferase family protein [Gammaproteobacteria bacterium]|nr:nucleotidyltransferase family protein [Gammaproteobacteria bacterium]
MEAIILAGGKGTRLGELTRLTPKPMVPVAGHPFLEYLLSEAGRRGVRRVVLSVGHFADQIEAHFGRRWHGIEIDYAHEDSPLGTGGAIALALASVRGERCFVLNGDTIFRVDLPAMLAFHRQHAAQLTLALKPMTDFDRYGTVQIENGRVIGFREKSPTREGLINGGVYLVETSLRDALPAGAFSFENDVMATRTDSLQMYGFRDDGYFIDIGIPEDYRRAGDELPKLIDLTANDD